MRTRRCFPVTAVAAGSCTAALFVVLVAGRWDARLTQIASHTSLVTCSLAAALCCGAAARRSSGRLRRPWALLTGTASCRLSGHVRWFYHQAVIVRVHYPSMSDLFWLAALPMAAAALFSFPVPDESGCECRRVLLDSLIVAGSTPMPRL